MKLEVRILVYIEDNTSDLPAVMEWRVDQFAGGDNPRFAADSIRGGIKDAADRAVKSITPLVDLEAQR